MSQRAAWFIGAVFINLALLWSVPPISADTPGKELGPAKGEVLSALQVPPQVFVGDAARLVLTMVPKASLGSHALIIDVADKLPQSKAVEISRLELDVNGKNPRIQIDFIALEPGRIELPPIEIGPYLVSKQRIEIASVLDPSRSGLETAPLEEPLLVPGTRLLLYGGLGLIVLAAIALFMGLLWGSAWYTRLKYWVRNRRLLRDITRKLNSFHRSEKISADDVGMLVALLRTYVEAKTGFACLALTGQELTVQAAGAPRPEIILSLGGIVALSDRLRFSGMDMGASNISRLDSEIRRLLVFLNGEAV